MWLHHKSFTVPQIYNDPKSCACQTFYVECTASCMGMWSRIALIVKLDRVQHWLSAQYWCQTRSCTNLKKLHCSNFFKDFLIVLQLKPTTHQCTSYIYIFVVFLIPEANYCTWLISGLFVEFIRIFNGKNAVVLSAPNTQCCKSVSLTSNTQLHTQHKKL